MGWTTVVEFNHDFAHDITGDNWRFLREELRRRLSQGEGDTTTAGVRFVTTFSRDKCLMDDEWEAFKRTARAVAPQTVEDLTLPTREQVDAAVTEGERRIAEGIADLKAKERPFDWAQTFAVAPTRCAAGGGNVGGGS